MKEDRPIDAVVAGYLGVDIAPGFGNNQARSFTELFRPGKLIETKGLHFSLGGVVANTGLALKKFGCQTELMGCVGHDVLGDIALTQFEEAGVYAGIRRTEAAGTAYGIVLAPPDMDRIFLEDPGCNRVFTADAIDYETVALSRLFHFGYPPLMDSLWANEGLELKRMLKRIRASGTTISLDMTLPDPDAPSGKADWRKLLSTTLPLVDIFVPSVEELLYMLDPERYARLANIAEQKEDGNMINAIPEAEYARLAEITLGMGVKILLIKAGHKGAYLRTGNFEGWAGSSFQPADAEGCPQGVWLSPESTIEARIQNASGAGDCAIAGFLAALLKGENVVAAGRYAMIAGRDNLYGHDAISGLRTWEEMNEKREHSEYD